MSQSPNARWVKLLAVALLIAVPTALGIPYLAAWLGLSRSDAVVSVPDTGIRGTPFIMRGLRQPPTIPAHEAGLPNGEPMICVSVGNRHRAYRQGGMAWESMVINDLIGRTPITVTYYPPSDEARVFTHDEADEPLEMQVGGFVEKRMPNGGVSRSLMLKLGTRFFFQMPGSPTGATEPEQRLRDLTFTRTTWKSWRDAYPDTDVFIGQLLPDEPEDER